MATWLYQLNGECTPDDYRLFIWENERWSWSLAERRKITRDPIEDGNKIVFFYAPGVGKECGFYGWAIVLPHPKDDNDLHFRPVAPSDFLKMHPWWNAEAKEIIREIRGPVARGTIWPIPNELDLRIGEGIAAWLNGHTSASETNTDAKNLQKPE